MARRSEFYNISYNPIIEKSKQRGHLLKMGRKDNIKTKYYTICCFLRDGPASSIPGENGFYLATIKKLKISFHTEEFSLKLYSFISFHVVQEACVGEKGKMDLESGWHLLSLLRFKACQDSPQAS